MRQGETTGRARLEVTGVVQGVGFRPFVYCLAVRLGLSGFVCNHSAGVTIEIQGRREGLSQFTDCLRSEAPPLSQIDSVESHDIPIAEGGGEFEIIESASIAAASTPISPDVATCDDCLAEMNDPANRRYRYPFINCTNCGPRYTIVRDIPYDRPLTTMSEFALCAECAAEYRDPANRRYHAQPNACPVCGPTVWFVSGESANDRDSLTEPSGFVGEEAIAAFHRSIDANEIVAIKGIGGFHLACAAESAIAIGKLRRRKGRVDKPLAIMVADIAAAARYAHVNPDEERLLSSRQRPIVLLRRRPDSALPDAIAPGNDFIGTMLPYSPLHALVVENQALVMTSGNVSEEPIARTNLEVRERLSNLADAFLLHNREIHVVCDDSVMRVSRGRELPVRRSRGYAPMPIRLSGPLPPVLAVGGELKATFCLTKNEYAYISPHIGDMGNLETLNAFRRAVEHFQRLFRSHPRLLACDMHPDYLSSQWARQHARSEGLRLFEVQHHHAHIASVLAEHTIDRGRQVIGISFDGTGYGTDGAVWGGEVLIATQAEFQRWAHLKYVPLPGGDAGVKHPYRVALAHLWAAGLPWDDRLPCVAACSPQEQTLLRRQLERNFNCVPTSSMGRLFDAVAALIGVRHSVNYEAQAAMEMEALASRATSDDAYPISICADTRPCLIDPAPMLDAICDNVMGNIPASAIAARFHFTIARLIVELARRARDERGLNTVALSGGVFQNVLLLEQSMQLLDDLGVEVLTHGIAPPNDGGLALGQAIIAAARLDDEPTTPAGQ